MDAQGARTFRPYPGFYLRRRDALVTAWIGVILIAVAVVTGQDGWSRREAKLVGGLACFVAVVRLGTLFLDASLREHTRYELRDGALHVHRDGRLVVSLPPERLRELRPKRVDARGMGSAELPHEFLSDLRSVNQWTTFVPALYADAELSVVPEIAAVCAEIRAWAEKHAPASAEKVRMSVFDPW